MSEPRQARSTPLGDVDPARSRHGGRRSAVALPEERVVAGTASGTVAAFDRGLGEQWRDELDGSVVAAIPFDDGVAVGARGARGEIRVYGEDGDLRFGDDTAADVGGPAKETRFFLPFVVSLATDGRRLYAAARRYERDGAGRHFESRVYAFSPAGEVVWAYDADASPISLAVDGDRVAVAYNRCPGSHDAGLVVLDAASGRRRTEWDPGTDGQRRVGDVSLLGDGVAVTSHGDYRGYLLDRDGDVAWRADLATPRAVDGETVYAYPNHVHATDAGVVFATGNTYPEEGRETAARHPDAHTAFGYSPGGERRWRESLGGFANGLGADGNALVFPCAQAFRERDPSGHGCRVLDVATGERSAFDAEGVVTAAAVDEGSVAAVEEPVVYHDDGVKRGAYRLHRWPV